MASIHLAKNGMEDVGKIFWGSKLEPIIMWWMENDLMVRKKGMDDLEI
jgi:hypothetical protein